MSFELQPLDRELRETSSIDVELAGVGYFFFSFRFRRNEPRIKKSSLDRVLFSTPFDGDSDDDGSRDRSAPTLLLRFRYSRFFDQLSRIILKLRRSTPRRDLLWFLLAMSSTGMAANSVGKNFAVETGGAEAGGVIITSILAVFSFEARQCPTLLRFFD